MDKKEIKKIAILAIKEEAKQKPNEKVIVGTTVLTYAELSERAENGDKFIQKHFVEPYINFLKESDEFRKRVFQMLGLE